jgi:hypothetical protein
VSCQISIIEPNEQQGQRRKFALSQNSKSLPARSNPSEKSLIIRGIVMASIELRAPCDTGRPAIRVARLRTPQTS